MNNYFINKIDKCFLDVYQVYCNGDLIKSFYFECEAKQYIELCKFADVQTLKTSTENKFIINLN